MQSPPPHAHDEFVDDVRVSTIDPALVLCRGGKIVWATSSLAELLQLPSTPTVMGYDLLRLFNNAGRVIDREVDPEDETQVTRIRLKPVSEPRERSVQLMRVEAPSDEPALANEIWLVSQVTVEAQLEAEPKAFESGRFELEDARKKLNQERDELIALVSHELRTPLTVISGYSNLLLSGRAGDLSDDQRRFLEETSRSCRNLNAFVTDLLDASHDHTGSFAHNAVPGSLEESVRGVIDFFLPLLEEKDVQVDLKIGSELPVAQFDPSRIEQVLTNLLGNAVKYTKTGSVINIDVEPRTNERGTMIEVAITDDGPGIAACDSERIFEPYVRSSGDRRAGGIGLGLAICRRILDAHGGTIGVGVAPGRGSRFVFSLPVARDAQWTES